MSAMELHAKARELKELKRMAEELDAEITAAEDAIKAAMGDQEQVVAGEYKISWKPVTSSRFDSTAFKKDFPDVAAEYTRQTTGKRFLIA